MQRILCTLTGEFPTRFARQEPRAPGPAIGHSEQRSQGTVLVPLKVSEIIRMIEADGWYLAATRGSHRQYKHPVKPGRVTVAGKPSKELPPGTERSILRPAGITRRAQ